jgi:hypothetical protein
LLNEREIGAIGSGSTDVLNCGPTRLHGIDMECIAPSTDDNMIAFLVTGVSAVLAQTIVDDVSVRRCRVAQQIVNIENVQWTVEG